MRSRLGQADAVFGTPLVVRGVHRLNIPARILKLSTGRTRYAAMCAAIRRVATAVARHPAIGARAGCESKTYSLC